MQILAYILWFGLAFDVSFFLRREQVCTAHACTVQYSASQCRPDRPGEMYRGRCNVNNVMKGGCVFIVAMTRPGGPVYRGRILKHCQPSENMSGPVSCLTTKQLTRDKT